MLAGIFGAIIGSRVKGYDMLGQSLHSSLSKCIKQHDLDDTTVRALITVLIVYPSRIDIQFNLDEIDDS